MTADRQKRGLEKKTQSDRQKIKFPWSKNAGAQNDPGAYNCREKTDC
jgi:hypothetical protein